MTLNSDPLVRFYRDEKTLIVLDIPNPHKRECPYCAQIQDVQSRRGGSVRDLDIHSNLTHEAEFQWWRFWRRYDDFVCDFCKREYTVISDRESMRFKILAEE
jgi:hypothetical protein